MTVFFVKPSFSLSQASLHRSSAMRVDIGIPIATEKKFRPSIKLSFADIDLDSIEITATLPSDQVQKCLDTIETMLNCVKCNL